MQRLIDFASNDYTLVWAIYLLGAIGLLVVIWRISRNWPAWLRVALRFVSACLLLVPAVVDAERSLYAPALIAIPFEWIVGGADDVAAALTALIQWSLLALLLLLIAQLGAHFLKRRRAAAPVPAAKELGEVLADEPLAATPPAASSS